MAASTAYSTTTSPAHTSSRAPRPTGLAPSAATRSRYPALCGCPDLSDHAQLVEAIGYAERKRRMSQRMRWTRAQRMAIDSAVAQVQADARRSLDRALAIWSDVQTARGMALLDVAQEAQLARVGSLVPA